MMFCTETSMLESMLSSMSSSMQLAAECMQQNPPDEKESQVFEGQEMFAQFIDSSKVIQYILILLLNLSNQNTGLWDWKNYIYLYWPMWVNLNILPLSTFPPPHKEPVYTQLEYTFFDWFLVPNVSVSVIWFFVMFEVKCKRRLFPQVRTLSVFTCPVYQGCSQN